MMDQWVCKNAQLSKCWCKNKQPQQLWRQGSAPPKYWSLHVGAGSVWRSLSEEMTNRAWAKSAGAERQKALLSSQDFRDPVQAYHDLLVQHGHDIFVPVPTDTRDKVHYAKYLHTFDSYEIQHIFEILREATDCRVHLDFTREISAGKFNAS